MHFGRRVLGPRPIEGNHCSSWRPSRVALGCRRRPRRRCRRRLEPPHRGQLDWVFGIAPDVAAASFQADYLDTTFPDRINEYLVDQ